MSKKMLSKYINLNTNNTDIDINSSLNVTANVTISSNFNAQNTTGFYFLSNVFIGSTNTSLSTLISQSGVAIGSIAMWNNAISTTLPTGWVECNGGTSNGIVTPDLRGKFVICAGTTYGQGSSGGSITGTLTVSSLPSHTHGTITTAMFSHSHSVKGFNAGSGSTGNLKGGVDGQDSIRTGSEGAHSHPIGATDTFGTGTPFSILPPYYALIYIIKVA